MLTRSISATLAAPTPTAALAQSINASSSRVSGESFLESSMPWRRRRGKGRPSPTAAATTGPAKGPRPASSMPQTGPRQVRSNAKSGMATRDTTAGSRGKRDPMNGSGEQPELSFLARRRRKPRGVEPPQPAAIEVELQAPGRAFKADAQHLGIGAGAAHARAPLRVVILAVMALAHQR